MQFSEDECNRADENVKVEAEKQENGLVMSVSNCHNSPAYLPDGRSHRAS